MGHFIIHDTDSFANIEQDDRPLINTENIINKQELCLFNELSLVQKKPELWQVYLGHPIQSIQIFTGAFSVCLSACWFDGPPTGNKTQ